MSSLADVDIDVADREQILNLIKYTPAMQVTNGVERKHNSGVYVTNIPTNPFENYASIDYQQAEERGYFKIDFLNMSVYQHIRDQVHFEELRNTAPPWKKLYNPDFCSQLVHVGNHYDTLIQMPEAVDSDVRLMMFLAIIRPGKKHLIGKPWKEVAETVWDKPDNDAYAFKKSHSCAYARLVMIHMNLINSSFLQE